MKMYDNYTVYPSLWNRQFPSHWDILPMYAVAKEKTICNCVDLPLLSVYLDVGVIPFSAKDEKRTNVTSKDLSKYQRVDSGDFVLNNQQAWRGSVGVSFHMGIVSPAYIVLAMNDLLNSRYANYLFRSRIMVDQYLINSKSVGSIQRNIYWPTLKRTQVIVPPRDEQDKIVRFLDWKVSNINQFISTKRKQIKVLQEQEKRIISDSVLHGLHNAPLWDSGNRWIGQIPASWDMIKLGKFCSFQNGISESGDFFTSGTPFVGYGDVYRHLELPETVSGVARSNEQQQKVFSVREGDIFFTRTSENIEEVGMAAVCKHTIDKAVFSGFVIRCRPRTAFIDTDYMKYYLQIPAIRNHFSSMMNIVIRASLGQNLLKQMPVVIPPMDEQRQIATYLDEQHTRYADLISTIQKEIDVLRDLKTRLISDTVTGKIDVRGIEIPEYEYVAKEADREAEEIGGKEENGEQEG